MKKYEEMMAKIIQCRKALIAPVTKEEQMAAQEMAVTIMKSEEFGNFCTLSPIYNELEKAK